MRSPYRRVYGQEICPETGGQGHPSNALDVGSQAYFGRFVFACSKNAGILALRVSESSGALPSYIRRSLESVQNFLSKYLSSVFLPNGSMIH